MQAIALRGGGSLEGWGAKHLAPHNSLSVLGSAYLCEWRAASREV